MDLKPCHPTLCVALKHNSIFTSHGELWSSAHLSRSNSSSTKQIHYLNSRRWTDLLLNLTTLSDSSDCWWSCQDVSAPPSWLMSPDMSLCQRDGGLFITVKNITALLPRRPPAERWHCSHCCNGCSSLAPFTSLTVDFDCSVSLYFHIPPPPSFVTTVSRRKRFIYCTTFRHHRHGLSINNNSSNAKKVKNLIKVKVKYPVHPNSAIRMQFAAEL